MITIILKHRGIYQTKPWRIRVPSHQIVMATIISNLQDYRYNKPSNLPLYQTAMATVKPNRQGYH